MASNFDFLIQFATLDNLRRVCVAAEANQLCDPETSAIQSRRALEMLTKSVMFLQKAYVDKMHLADMLRSDAFVSFIDHNATIIHHTDYIRRAGNTAAHGGKVSRSVSFFALINLHEFVQFVLRRLDAVKEIMPFNNSLVPKQQAPYAAPDDSQTGCQEFAQQVPPQAVAQPQQVTVPPLSMSEAETRKAFIDLMLTEAGWDIAQQDGLVVPGMACVEVELSGMPNTSGKGYADYVLFGPDRSPLAVIEAKKASVDPNVGIQQARLYADCLFARYGSRPVIYITNGFHTYVEDGRYPMREVYAFHSMKDLQKIFYKRTYAMGSAAEQGTPFFNTNNDITDRYYQKTAVKSVFEHFVSRHRRALLVMATGTGKTRTAISIVDVMMRCGHVENVLFLADRTALVTQAQRNFAKLLPNVTTSIVSGSGSDTQNSSSPTDWNARILFSTYQTMINFVDTDDEVKKFSTGRFDLIIIDEAHRSVFGKYGAIFDYFDSLMVGLTATPKDEVDRSTYQLLELDDANYAYELDQAVNDGYLVPYKPFSKGTDLLDNGIKYNDLSDDERKQLEDVWVFESESPNPDNWMPRDFASSELNHYLFNTKTVDLVIEDLMEHGLHIQSGDMLGKTIIFAANHKHAELIVDRFNLMYPHLAADATTGRGAFCQLIDNQVKYAQKAIDNFSDPQTMPQIAVSVDMMDTGIDVPDVLNLVFFKQVRSKIKFWQMIGRGTRLCDDIFGPGLHKQCFYIFDWCKNFEFFSMNAEGNAPTVPMSLSERMFNIKAELAYELQAPQYQSQSDLKAFHDTTKQELQGIVRELSDHFTSVRKEMEHVAKYKADGAFLSLTASDVQELKDHISPLVPKVTSDDFARRFDYLVMTIELACLNQEKNAAKSQNAVISTARTLKEKKATLPEVQAKMGVIDTVLSQDFWDSPSLPSLEYIREQLRDLVHLLSSEHKTFTITIDDSLTDSGDAPEVVSTMTYREKVTDYLSKNHDKPFLRKIREMEQLTHDDIAEIERVLWTELGSRDDYRQYATGALMKDSAAAFIRSIEHVDRKVAMKRFSDYISGHQLSAEQEEFLNEVIDYVSQNGDINTRLLQEYPFTRYHKIDSIFGTDIQYVGAFVRDFHNVITA